MLKADSSGSDLPSCNAVSRSDKNNVEIHAENTWKNTLIRNKQEYALEIRQEIIRMFMMSGHGMVRGAHRMVLARVHSLCKDTAVIVFKTSPL
jgi:hypothetical protein